MPATAANSRRAGTRMHTGAPLQLQQTRAKRVKHTTPARKKRTICLAGELFLRAKSVVEVLTANCERGVSWEVGKFNLGVILPGFKFFLVKRG